MLRVLIADDHAIVRRGLIQILADEFPEIAVGEAENARRVLQLVREQQWDIVVLDISMPEKSGLEVLKELKQARPELPVLILTTHPEEQYALRVIRAGASGYITKESAVDHLVEAVRKVLRGGKYISPALAELLATRVGADQEKPLHGTLSDREYEVMCLLASGKTPTEVADELSLSVKTVSTYRARILEKMGMKTNAELTYYAIKNHLID